MADADPTATISGIGGFFFRSADPETPADWYQQHFGISKVSDGPPWSQEQGMTVFAPFPADTDYFGRSDQAFMLNFRVSDIDAALGALESSGVRIDDEKADLEYGRFAWVYDPEDNKIELWEPPE